MRTNTALTKPGHLPGPSSAQLKGKGGKESHRRAHLEELSGFAVGPTLAYFWIFQLYSDKRDIILSYLNIVSAGIR